MPEKLIFHSKSQAWYIYFFGDMAENDLHYNQIVIFLKVKYMKNESNFYKGKHP